jgi:gliding motility-associated lipoprotein GldH
MKGMKNQLGLIVLLFSVWLTSCDTNTVYSSYEDIEDGKWYVNQAPSFTFRIEDTTQPYHIYYNLRNALSYPYYNLYLTRYLSDSSGRTIESRLDELILMDPKTGEPRGDGLGDIFDHKVLIKQNYRFPKPGQYTIKIKQYMRQNPLPDVLSVGVSVEKAAGK